MACDPKKIISDLQVTGETRSNGRIIANDGINVPDGDISITAGNVAMTTSGSFTTNAGNFTTNSGNLTVNSDGTTFQGGNVHARDGFVGANSVIATTSTAAIVAVPGEVFASNGFRATSGGANITGDVEITGKITKVTSIDSTGTISTSANVEASANISATGIINGVEDIRFNGSTLKNAVNLLPINTTNIAAGRILKVNSGQDGLEYAADIDTGYINTFDNTNDLLTKIALFLGTEGATTTDGGPGLNPNETNTIYTTNSKDYFFFPNRDSGNGGWTENKTDSAATGWNLIG